MPIAKVSENLDIAQSTIVATTKELGFPGGRDLGSLLQLNW